MGIVLKLDLWYRHLLKYTEWEPLGGEYDLSSKFISTYPLKIPSCDTLEWKYVCLFDYLKRQLLILGILNIKIWQTSISGVSNVYGS